MTKGLMMNTRTRLFTLGAGLAVGIGTMTAMADLGEVKDTPTPEALPTDTAEVEVPDLIVAEEEPTGAADHNAAEQFDPSGTCNLDTSYWDEETSTCWPFEDLDSGEGGPDPDDPTSPKTKPDWQPPNSICEGTEDDGWCISEEPITVVEEGDPQDTTDDWDCRVDGNGSCGVMVEGEWYVLDFTTMTFAPRD